MAKIQSRPIVKAEQKAPDQVALNPLQQKRLSLLTGIDEAKIKGNTVAQLSDSLRWDIDLSLFLFRKICGKVVKKDPITGVEYPVPFATVYVEDTDCTLLSYQPSKFPWTWFFPLNCKREVIATTKTDACGNFCVWVPRFDIDWILQWRKKRFCYPIIFERPRIIDPMPELRWPRKPFPEPDPAPWQRFQKLALSANETVGGTHPLEVKTDLANTNRQLNIGDTDEVSESLKGQRVFSSEMPPPLPEEFQKAISRQNVVTTKEASPADAVRAVIGDKLGLADASKLLEAFDYRRFIGPFYRCFDVYVPEWKVIVDVPDITFRVTQDTNGDGTEENIYSESYFDVRWNAGAIPDVKLLASSDAKESRSCHNPSVPCGDVPAILFAGFMSLSDPSYFNATTGYAKRPNRPRPFGAPVFPAQTPFCGVLQLYGCVDVKKAAFYRFKKSTDGGATWSSITGLSWNNYQVATPIPIVADGDGWYPINPINPVTLSAVPRASLAFPNFLLNWPTPANDTTLLKIELGDAAKNHVVDSSDVTITSDNTSPVITLTQWAWKYVGEPDAALRNLAGIPCPMIKRGAVPKHIELVLATFVSDEHLRNASLSTSGCGGGSFFQIADPLNNPTHWHQTVMDNTEALYQRYRLDASTMPGCYSFNCHANGRAMNPSGADGGNMLPTDWYYDPVYLWSQLPLSVAVVNEDL
jgi:hypothetical protein